MLISKNINLKRPYRKTTTKYLGPYTISKRISTHVYRLTLPSLLRKLYNVFYMLLLEKYYLRTANGTAIEQLDPKLVEDDRFKLKEIVDYYDGEYDVK